MNPSVARRNPLAILLVTFFLLVPVLLSFDVITPIVFLLLGLCNLGIAGKVQMGKYLKTVALLSIAGIGLFLLNLLFPAKGVNGLQRGVTVFLRSLSLVSISVGYIFLVDPYDLIRALMQNLGLSPRVGFSLFAGWNVIPLLRRDLHIILHARAVRFQGMGALAGEGPRPNRKVLEVKKAKVGANGPITGLRQVGVALLAGAVRHGEQVSLSMAARGIEGVTHRSFIKIMPWTRKDTAYCVAAFLIVLVVFGLLVKSGNFIFELG